MTTPAFKIGNNIIYLKEGQDKNAVRRKYTRLMDRKPGSLFLDNNPAPPLDFEAEREKAELSWQQGVKITQLYFKHDITCAEISSILNISVEVVARFITDETQAIKQMKLLKDAEENSPEPLSETLKRL